MVNIYILRLLAYVKVLASNKLVVFDLFFVSWNLFNIEKTCTYLKNLGRHSVLYDCRSCSVVLEQTFPDEDLKKINKQIYKYRFLRNLMRFWITK